MNPRAQLGEKNLSGKGAVKSHKPCYEHLLHSLAGRHCSPENTSSTHVNSWLMQKEMFFVESLSYLCPSSNPVMEFIYESLFAAFLRNRQNHVLLLRDYYESNLMINFF